MDTKAFETADTDADTDMKIFETADTDADTDIIFFKNSGHGHGHGQIADTRVRRALVD